MTSQKYLVGAAIAAQALIGYCTWLTYSAFTYFWHEALGGKPLPFLTDLSLHSMRWIPILAAFILALGFRRTATWTAYTLLGEALFLAIFILGIGYPIYFILHEIT